MELRVKARRASERTVLVFQWQNDDDLGHVGNIEVVKSGQILYMHNS